MNVKKIGNNTEEMLCNFLQEKGYWVYLAPYNIHGQPCDVIAIKDNVAILMDVKHCSNDSFSLNRIEPNQKTCFDYAKECGNDNVGFAIYFEEEGKFRWLSMTVANFFTKEGKKSIKSSYMLELDNALLMM